MPSIEFALKMATEIPTNEWGTFFDKNFADIKWHHVENIMDDLSIRSAMASEYVSLRYTNGCGDSGHEVALNRAMKIRKKIRKVLGYSIP
jgi:hypothetical protein